MILFCARKLKYHFEASIRATKSNLKNKILQGIWHIIYGVGRCFIFNLLYFCSCYYFCLLFLVYKDVKLISNHVRYTSSVI
jgi:hypothetical protein